VLHAGSLTYFQDAPPVHVAAPAADDGESVPALPAARGVQDHTESDGDDLALAITNGLAEADGKAEFLQAAEANKDNQNAEWQLDSDASDSGPSDSSSSDDSDDDGSDDGELMDPEEMVRLLMAESRR
jgi:H/ACA ribonucleoprotein complex non-core subunit NAF1